MDSESQKIIRNILAHEKSKAGDLTQKEQEIMYNLYLGRNVSPQDMEGLNLERMVTQLRKNNEDLRERFGLYDPRMQGLASDNLRRSEKVVETLQSLIDAREAQEQESRKIGKP